MIGSRQFFAFVLFVFTMLTACVPATTSSGTREPGEGLQRIDMPEANPSRQTEIVDSLPYPVVDQTPDDVPSEDSQGTGTINAGDDVRMENDTMGDLDNWVWYENSGQNYRIAYPPNFLVEDLDQVGLKQMDPPPIQVTYFRDPLLSGERPDEEPAQFTIRVFSNDTNLPLEKWLTTWGLFNPDGGWTSEQFHSGEIFGLAIESPQFMAPGYFVYIEDGGLIYELTPLGDEALIMLTTFSLIDQ